MRRKLCGKQWPAHLCAPDAMHQCTRPVAQLSDRIGHPGDCCCKCGTWHPSSEAHETGERVRGVEAWAREAAQ